MAINVLIADDHPGVRDSLHSLMGPLTDLRPVTIADDHGQGVAHVCKDDVDVVVLNVTGKIWAGGEKIRNLQKSMPHAKLIIMALRTDRHYVQRIFSIGASGYLLKDCAYEELPQAVRCVCAGGLFVSQEIAFFPECCRLMVA